MLTNSIESAQRKVEGRNFGIRNVLQYDDVMNRQREIIYAQRNEVLDGKDLKEQILKMLRQAVESRVKTYLPAETPKEDWNLEGLRDYYRGWCWGRMSSSLLPPRWKKSGSRLRYRRDL